MASAICRLASVSSYFRLFPKSEILNDFSQPKSRDFHRSSSVSNNKQLAKRAKLLSKFYNVKSKKWHVDSHFKSGQSFAPHSRESHPKSVAESRRVAILNSLFLKTITEIISTGEIGQELEGLGIEITRIIVSPHFDFTNIFWVSSNKNPENIQAAQMKLKLCAGKLRHVLCSLKVLGMVPRIIFVEDKTAYLAQEIEEKLKIADFGPEVDDSDLECLSAKNNLDSIEDHETLSSSEENSDIEDSLAPENQNKAKVDRMVKINLYGLDHDSLMQMVQQRMKKARADHRKESLSESNCRPGSETHSVESLIMNEQVILEEEDRNTRLKNFIRAHKLAKLRKEKDCRNEQMLLLKHLDEQDMYYHEEEKFDEDEFDEESMMDTYDSKFDK